MFKPLTSSIMLCYNTTLLIKLKQNRRLSMYTEEYLNELQELSLDDFKTHFLKDKVFEIKVENDTKLVVTHENEKIKKVFYRQESTGKQLELKSYENDPIEEFHHQIFESNALYVGLSNAYPSAFSIEIKDIKEKILNDLRYAPHDVNFKHFMDANLNIKDVVTHEYFDQGFEIDLEYFDVFEDDRQYIVDYDRPGVDTHFILLSPEKLYNKVTDFFQIDKSNIMHEKLERLSDQGFHTLLDDCNNKLTINFDDNDDQLFVFFDQDNKLLSCIFCADVTTTKQMIDITPQLRNNNVVCSDSFLNKFIFKNWLDDILTCYYEDNYVYTQEQIEKMYNNVGKQVEEISDKYISITQPIHDYMLFDKKYHFIYFEYDYHTYYVSDLK